ncbi:MAG: hypothetical protein ACP5GL_06490 [Infirmifilum sp.]
MSGRFLRFLLGVAGALVGAFSALLWAGLALIFSPFITFMGGRIEQNLPLLLLLIVLAAFIGGFSAALHDQPLSILIRLLGRVLNVYILQLAMGGSVTRLTLQGLNIEVDFSTFISIVAFFYVIPLTLVDSINYHLSSLEWEEKNTPLPQVNRVEPVLEK